MDVNSRVLERWTEELIKENQAMYAMMQKESEELGDIARLFYNSERDILHALYREYDAYGSSWTARPREEKDEINNIIYGKLHDGLTELGFYLLPKEEFIVWYGKRGGRLTRYSVDYKGVRLDSYKEIVDSRGRRDYLYSIQSHYFFLKYSRGHLDLVQRKTYDELMEYAEKESRVYVQSIIVRVEKRFGKVLGVTDSYVSNMERVYFNCENGDCYLEMIVAGGYNIQRLHNRILVKPIKK